MPTINKLVAHGRARLAIKTKAPALHASPQKRGVVTRVYVVSPKKPNSANRCCCRVKLTNGLVVTAYVPGERNNVAEHQSVLVRGGRVKDLPGVRCHIVRGALDVSAAARAGEHRSHRLGREAQPEPLEVRREPPEGLTGSKITICDLSRAASSSSSCAALVADARETRR